jgi:tetratricopeptide (TPR) repeat protein
MEKPCLFLVTVVLAASAAIAQPRLNGLEIPEQATVSMQSLAHHAPAAARKAYRKAARAVAEDNLPDAIDQLETGLASDPENADAHSDAGVLYTMMGNPEKAISHFEKALKINPKASGASLLLGLSMVALQRYTDAALRPLERVKLSFPEARMALADIHLHQGKLEKAREELNAYMATGHNAYRRIAEAWLQMTTF